MSEALIYSDGACSGNPGPGGWGAIVIENSQHVVELGAADPSTTNNRMEMTAIIETLKQLSPKVTKCTICTDSTYVIRGSTQWLFGWKKRGWQNSEGKEISNKDLWLEMDHVLYRLKTKTKLEWKYVPGHAGIVGNERCDQIAVAFSQGLRPFLYEGDLHAYSYSIDIVPPEFPLPEMKSYSKTDKSKSNFYLSYVDGVLLKHNTWPECQNRVKGRSGAKFKKASSEAEAKAVIETWGLKPSKWDDL